uniref:Na_Ca_ex domain-containing protein n=1 Tax=Heligmosomoides polygyrus TaxID=6339 RepID=A0A183GR79_HELPZ
LSYFHFRIVWPTLAFTVVIYAVLIENRQYKEGFVDDNNEHLSYFHFRIVWPTLAFTVVIYAVLIGGILGSLATDDLPNAQELRRAFWTRYGALRFRCNSTVPFPKDGLPSVLNLFELNVFGNLMFRICACIPIAIRLFVVHCRRELIRADFLSSSFVHNMMNEVVWALSFVEVFAMGLFSIITIRKDSTALHRYCKVTFAMTAAVNMLVTTAVIFAYKRNSTKSKNCTCISNLTLNSKY